MIETGDGAAGPLSGAWTQWDAANTLNRDGAGHLVAASAARHIAWRNDETFFEDQYGEIVCLTTPGGGDFYNIALRASGEGATAQGYWIYSGLTGSGLEKTLAGADAGIVSFDGVGVVAGDVIRAELVGSTLHLYVNSVLRGTYVDPSPIASGAVGAGLFGPGAKIETWEGGNIGGPVPPPPEEEGVGGAPSRKRSTDFRRARRYEEQAELEEIQRREKAEAQEIERTQRVKKQDATRKAKDAARASQLLADAIEKDDEEYILNFLMERL